MRRRTMINSMLTAGVISLTGCAGRSGPAFEESFETGLGEWRPDAAIGPEVDLDEFEWEVTVSDDQAFRGERSLRVWNEGDYDDGVTWVTHPVEIPPEGADTATARAQLWSESESFNTLRDVVMRLGPTPPETEEEFPNPGVNTTALGETAYGGLREPLWLAEGWREYTFEWTIPSLSTDTVYISVGTSVIWEGDATHYVDDLSVAFES